MTENAARITELLSNIQKDVSASIELLSIAADYLKNRKPMPHDLADYLAKAFRRTAQATENADGLPIERVRMDALLHSLGMTRDQGRPRTQTPDETIAAAIVVFGDEISKQKNVKIIAKACGVSDNTIRNRIKDAPLRISKAEAQLRQIMKDNELESIVRNRNGHS